jgi:predicted permease
LSESMLITFVGGLLGVAIAPLVSRALLSYVSPTADLSARIDPRIVLLALAVSVLTGALCGVASAVQAGRISLAASLKEKSPIGGSARVRRILVIAQMSFALVLLIGAGLFVRTLAHLYAKGPGFTTTNLIMFRLDPTSLGYPSARAEQLMRDVGRSLRESPGVENVAVANSSLLSGATSTTHLTIQGDARVTTERPVQFMRPGPGFFSTLGTRVVAGRDFTDSDARAPGTEPRPSRSIIVNERFARRYFGSRNPIGERVGLGNRPNSKIQIEIVGVVSDFPRRSLRDDAEMVFFPFWDRDSGDGVFYLRVRGTTESAFAAIRAAVARVDKALPVVSIRTFDDQIDQSLSSERMLAMLSSSFGLIALLLAVVGLYGVMSFVVTRRTQEIGVRLALGATPSTALWLIVRDALAMTSAGAIIALPAVWLLTRMVESRLFGVHAMDLPTIGMASCLLMLVGLGSAMVPAWRAASVSPTEALRDS